MSIQNTLNEREKTYGSFEGHALITQLLKYGVKVLPERWDNLSPHHKEAIEMILHKIARVINGDPDYLDNWHDIAGYATLVENIISSQSNS